MKYFFCFVLGVALFGTVAVAEEPDVQLEEVVVTASRIEEAVKETTSDVRVITGTDIEKMNVQFVNDVLRKVPELNIVQNGGPGTVSTAFLRGNESKHILVMIDGVRQNDPATGVFDLSGITTDDIERIEIVKGAQSTLYGSDASGGVINIITRRGKEGARTDALIEVGSYESFKTAVAFSGGSVQHDYRITASYYDTEGISAAAEGAEKDGYENISLSGKFGIRLTERSEVMVTGKYYYDYTELDDFTTIAIDHLTYTQRRNHYLISGVGTFSMGDTWEQILTVSTVKEDISAQGHQLAFYNSNVITRINSADWQHNLFFSDSYTVIAGAEYRNEKGDSKGNFKQSVDITSLFISNKIKVFEDKEKLILDAGLRYDAHEITENETTYKVGVLYEIAPAMLKVRGNYGTGFRAPTLNELFLPLFGNPDLEPEKSTYWDAGLEKGIIRNSIILSATYFDQEYRNLIQYGPPPTFTPENIAAAEIKGVEIDLVWRTHKRVNIKAGYTYLDTEDEATGEPLTRRPEDKFSVLVEYFTKKISIIADYVYVGERYDSAVLRELEPYKLVNISGNYRVNNRLSVFGRIENLFDEEYEEAGSYGTPGFSIFGGIKLTNL